MPIFQLRVQADLENVASISAPEDTQWLIRLQCGHCGSEADKLSSVCTSEEVEVPGSRGKANLVQKCKFCNRVGTVNVVSGSGAVYTAEHAGKLRPLVSFDMRGFHPASFQPTAGFTITSNSGKTFENADLSDDFAEYDDDADEPVGVYNLKHDFVAAGK